MVGKEIHIISNHYNRAQKLFVDLYKDRQSKQVPRFWCNNKLSVAQKYWVTGYFLKLSEMEDIQRVNQLAYCFHKDFSKKDFETFIARNN